MVLTVVANLKPSSQLIRELHNVELRRCFGSESGRKLLSGSGMGHSVALSQTFLLLLYKLLFRQVAEHMQT